MQKLTSKDLQWGKLKESNIYTFKKTHWPVYHDGCCLMYPINRVTNIFQCIDKIYTVHRLIGLGNSNNHWAATITWVEASHRWYIQRCAHKYVYSQICPQLLYAQMSEIRLCDHVTWMVNVHLRVQVNRNPKWLPKVKHFQFSCKFLSQISLEYCYIHVK